METVFRKRHRVILAMLLAVMGLASLEAILFHTRLYPRFLEPNSSTGLFEIILWREQQAQHRLGDNLVVTVGNSRFAYSPKLADARVAQTGYYFRSAGDAGTNALAWYYMLRDLDPTAQRYRAVVIGVDDYDDEDRDYQPDTDMSALHYVIARLRWSDAIEFARSFHGRQMQWEAFRSTLLKGIVYQTDIQAFLSHPLKRVADVRLYYDGYPNWVYDYVESDVSMTGLQVDWATRKATFPASFNKDQRDTIHDVLYAPGPQNGRLAAYRRRWLGRIIDRYRGSRTKIIFVRLPRGPIVRPAYLSRKSSSSIRDFASRPNVFLVDEHALDSLEDPELFKDCAHLNREGTARLSVMMPDEVARILGPPFQRAAK